MPQDPAPQPADAPDILARARRTRVAVVGGGVGGLVAALEWAKIGAHVTVVEANDRFGGTVETAVLDGMPVDLTADAVPLGAERLRALLDELRLRDAVEPAPPLAVWVAALPKGSGGAGGAASLPVASVAGIPANPWAEDVRRIIGWRGAWRAYLDRLRPPLTIGFERRLGALARSRMGDRVVDLLIAPVTRGLYGLDPDEVDVEVAAPGLSTALTRVGSLSGAVFELLPEDSGEGDVPATPTRASLRGGMSTLIDALTTRLADLSADLRPSHRVAALTAPTRDDDGAWRVQVQTLPVGDTTDAETPADDAIIADVVIVATGGTAARALLTTAGIDVEAAPGAALDIVTLVVDDPRLDDAPRGRAVYPATGTAGTAGTDRALGLTHLTAEWPWLAAAARAAGRHVLRVTLPADDDRSDEEAIEVATGQASALLGIDLAPPVTAARRRAERAAPASALGHAERTARARSAVAARQGLHVVGAWVAGSGLAQVVADAQAEVDRMRSALLWGSAASSRSPRGPDEGSR